MNINNYDTDRHKVKLEGKCYINNNIEVTHDEMRKLLKEWDDTQKKLPPDSSWLRSIKCPLCGSNIDITYLMYDIRGYTQYLLIEKCRNLCGYSYADYGVHRKIKLSNQKRKQLIDTFRKEIIK